MSTIMNKRLAVYFNELISSQSLAVLANEELFYRREQGVYYGCIHLKRNCSSCNQMP